MALKGANTSAQWYQDNYPGAVFSRLDKFVIHTTETRGWPGYSGGASSPNATYDPRLRQIRQHHSNNRSARALRDPSGTAVRENRDNVFQLEIICYSDKRLGDSVGGLWVGNLTDTHMRDIAAMMRQLNDELGLPLQSSVNWREGATSYYGGVRLSGSQYDAYRGILGHVHVSGNSHWDPGGFRYSKLKPFLQGDDDVSEADVRKGLKAALEEAANRSTPYGRQVGDSLREILAPVVEGRLNNTIVKHTDKNVAWHFRAAVRKLDAIGNALQDASGVDAKALAEELNRIDAEEVANAVVDEQAERLADNA